MAEQLVCSNISHLNLVSDTLEELMSNILQGNVLAEFVMSFAMYREVYFVYILIQLLVRGRTVLSRSNSSSKLVQELKGYYSSQ